MQHRRAGGSRFPERVVPARLRLAASGNPPRDDLAVLLGNGAFDWRLPGATESRSKLSECLGLEKGNDNVGRALSDIVSIGVRTGLLHPVFDPASLEEMPFRRSTTVVADTSGVLQGALDFVVRHLPKARVKVPAIVQMEIVNFMERFFSLRRKGNEKRRAHELIEHLKSQGGQRTLVRLEMQGDTEIERTWLLGDPLREAFQRDSELSGLNLSVPIKAYVDRLILEAARRHQAESGPGHRIRLLTGDQGLARMALAEGISPLYLGLIYTKLPRGRVCRACLHDASGRWRRPAGVPGMPRIGAPGRRGVRSVPRDRRGMGPAVRRASSPTARGVTSYISPLYFRSMEADDFFGRRLTGQTFDPFTGQIRRTPLPMVL